MKDRIPGEGKEGLVILTPVDETKHLYKMERADDPVEPGNPLSKATLLTDEACRLYGYDNTAVPDDVFKAIAPHVVTTIIVTAPAGSTVTVSDGKRTIKESEVDGLWTFHVQPGNWTVTAERGYDSQSALIPVTEVRDYTVRLLMEKIYGAEWDGGESPEWSRTDDSANYPNPTPAVNNGTGWSPFDEFMPWAGMRRSTDENGNEVVSIPKFWYKWTRNGTAMKLQIADYPADGFYVSPAHSDRGDGSGERDIVYVGRYHCNAAGKSATNVKPSVNVTVDGARKKLKSVSKEYFPIDYQTYWTICMLYLVEFADWRNQYKIGYGCSQAGEGEGVFLMGRTDAMQYHTGTDAASRTTYGSTQYRHIEDLWGNVFDLISNAGAYYTNNIKISSATFFKGPDCSGESFAIQPASLAVGYIKNWTPNPTAPGFEFAIYPNEKVSTNSYVRDYFDFVTNGMGTGWNGSLIFGGSYFRNYQNGLFCLKCAYNTEYKNIGFRLIRLPGYGS